MIPFNKAVYLPRALEYVAEVVKSSKIAGDGKYTKLCSAWMEQHFHAPKVLMTTSCTAALEMTAILLDIQPGDEVIMPSYTFVSTANAFVLRGAKCVFVDIRPDTMNIDEKLIEEAISEKTKAIVVVHYAGVGCEMDTIMDISRKYNIPVVEDAAQGVMATYKGKALGTIGDFGCYSFHETKNYTMGEGGALVINNEDYLERAEIIREKGTNRSKFYRGEIDKYTWVDIGSSFLPSEFNVSYLYGQLLMADEINNNRIKSWRFYFESLKKYEEEGIIELPVVPSECTHNAHMFYLKWRNVEQRSEFIDYMKEKKISCVFHYVPLHSSFGGEKYGKFTGIDRYTTVESNRLVRLPMYYALEKEELRYIFDTITEWVEKI
ncbi:MAG: dTDP-4-amino-4,6-dideoxygalactose transaminase [Lachnospiraceae bacterium]|nr:dTDP-4-amino-4,6-dideoxygalactose transaminase [Lachnospiraceae bacterium]